EEQEEARALPWARGSSRAPRALAAVRGSSPAQRRGPGERHGPLEGDRGGERGVWTTAWAQSSGTQTMSPGRWTAVRVPPSTRGGTPRRTGTRDIRAAEGGRKRQLRSPATQMLNAPGASARAPQCRFGPRRTAGTPPGPARRRCWGARRPGPGLFRPRRARAERSGTSLKRYPVLPDSTSAAPPAVTAPATAAPGMYRCSG
ncbi:unnamed protein product, partial [Prorocentrum cordatum]